MSPRRRPRVLVFIVAYKAETTIRQVLARIPPALADDYDVEVLVIDDSSDDRTFELGERGRREGLIPFTLTVLRNPENQGYGGNQKIGFRYAIDHGFDIVALVHGDGQYAPERLPELLAPIARGEADAVFGSRMLAPHGALSGGMPLYKFIGNKILTRIQNLVMGARLSEWHSGYRAYATAALRRVPFDLNADVFHFDTEIVIQLLLAGQRISEVPIPTFYGDETSRVNGLRYARDVVRAVVAARLHMLNLGYARRFDCAAADRDRVFSRRDRRYEAMRGAALALVGTSRTVVVLGSAGADLAGELRARGNAVTEIALAALVRSAEPDPMSPHGLAISYTPLDLAGVDVVVLLDVIERVASPELFVEHLRGAARFAPDLRLIVGCGNIGFVVTRLQHLVGRAEYGRGSIMNRGHLRLFTLASLKRMFLQDGFRLLAVRGLPAPYAIVFGDGALARLLAALNRALIRLSRGWFAHQILIEAQPRRSLDLLLREAQRQSRERAAAIADTTGKSGRSIGLESSMT
jgi:glycosyltransferase involved in cell wall biosynthesis